MASAASRADVQLNALFSDHVVLQQGRPVPVWGTAAPGEGISVAFGGQSTNTIADKEGRWSVELSPMAASREPRVLLVKGTNAIAVKDVLVGEVWLLSGQSNMAFLMESMARPAAREPKWPERAKRDMAEANDPLLREFRVDNRPAERPKDNVITRTGWMTWTPKAAGAWAAMAVYFGQRLRASLDTPVGIVLCAWGGSSCAAWVSGETVRSPEINTLWPEDILGARINLGNSYLYNGMLRPLAPFAISGFAWYQGETEAVPAFNPYVHRFILSAMIQDWRRLWGQPALPFYIVQLPNREGEPRWPIVRESQAAALRLAHTRMMTAIDLGQAWDLHPRNKPDMANRLADLVLAREYGRNTWPGEATFERVVREGDALRVTFRGAEAGLTTKDGLPPAEFEVAGEDRIFHPAQAIIDGSSVRVSAALVQLPVAVRYAWKPAPVVNLMHRGGMPVPPFRSDEWPVDGQERIAQSLPAKAQLAHVTSGAALLKRDTEGWTASRGIQQLGKESPLLMEARGAVASVTIRGFPVRPGVPASPDAYWAIEPPLDAAKGFTIEVKGHLTRAGNAYRGLDLEAGVRRPDGSFRRYLLSAFPMRLLTYQNNLAPRTPHGTDTVVLRTGLEADPGVYRIAVRPDGIAQVYHNGTLVGTTPGEILSGVVPEKAYVRIGKTVAEGEWIANLHHCAFDCDGAFAPGPPDKTSE